MLLKFLRDNPLNWTAEPGRSLCTFLFKSGKHHFYYVVCFVAVVSTYDFHLIEIILIYARWLITICRSLGPGFECRAARSWMFVMRDFAGGLS